MTTDAQNHPDAQRLREFAAGALGDHDVDRIGNHLDNCEACRAAVDSVLLGHGFLDRLRSATTAGGDVPEGQAERRRAARALSREVRRFSSTVPDHGGEGPSPPGEVGQYVVLGELGRGGMGVVYQARHRDLRRLVALKMILAGGFASEVQRQRFRREAELAARVQHPHIVQVYEVGLHDGRPFLAMEWVAGGTLADRLGGDPWPPYAAAGLVETVARAIDVAHRSGVVHRDLKPSNILLQRGANAGAGAAADGPLAGAIPKVADFGLARAMDADGSLTATGLTMGSPEYMAPEQAAGAEAGPAADIYALGAVLYRLLTGHPPFRGDTPMEVLQALVSAEPIAPRRFRPALPRDLETITLKAMAREPQRRYATAEALADELRRFLADEPIRAQPPSALYQLRKFARRNKAIVGGVAATGVALVLGLVTATLFAVGEARQRGQAEHNAREASYQTYRARIAAAVAALQNHDVADAARQLEAAPEALRGWEWRHLSSRLDDSSEVVRFRPEEPAILLSGPEGLRVGTFTSTGLRFRDESGREFPERSFPRLAYWVCSRAGPATEWLFADWENPRLVRLRDDTGRVVCMIKPREGAVADVALSPDRARVAVGLNWGPGGCGIGLFDTSSGQERANWAAGRGQMFALAFSPDGRRLASGGDDPVVRVWDAATGQPLAECRGHTSKVLSLAFQQDGSRLVTGSHDGTVRQWDPRTGREVEPPYDRHTAEVSAAVYSPDGQRVASAGADRTVRLWRASGRQDQAVLRGHTGTVAALAFSRDGRRLVSASNNVVISRGDGTVRFWEAAPEATLPVLAGHTSYVYPVAYSPDPPGAGWIASGGWDSKVRLWDAATGEICATLPHPGNVRALAFTPDGAQLVSGGADDRELLVWDVFNARISRRVAAGRRVESVAVSPDGARTAAGTYGLGARFTIWEVATGRKIGDGAGTPFAFSPDGRWLAGTDADEKTVVLWDAHTFRPVAHWQGHTGGIIAVAFDRAGGRLVSASSDHTVRLWDVARGRCLRVFEGHSDEVFSAVFHPDGTRIASGGRDRAVWLWDASSGQEVAHLPGHTSYIWSLAFSPDGKTLVSGSGDSTVRLWDTEPLRVRYQARREAVALRPEAERLVEQLCQQKNDPAAVVEALRTDPSLSEPLRHAALRAVLRRASPPGSGK